MKFEAIQHIPMSQQAHGSIQTMLCFGCVPGVMI